ncbi:hypothetical protein H4Q26_009372 [Puccinia striiformis f. sp. tritici PST-130]|nr:hypothetical protein H4Q26_009372 [Puccinia striiformis f. sp. tritici PST-130]
MSHPASCKDQLLEGSSTQDELQWLLKILFRRFGDILRSISCMKTDVSELTDATCQHATYPWCDIVATGQSRALIPTEWSHATSRLAPQMRPSISAIHMMNPPSTMSSVSEHSYITEGRIALISWYEASVCDHGAQRFPPVSAQRGACSSLFSEAKAFLAHPGHFILNIFFICPNSSVALSLSNRASR